MPGAPAFRSRHLRPTRYRDLQFLVSFGVQLWMYATPVIYPLSQVPERFRWIILASPMTPILESFRYAFLGAGTVDLMHLFYTFLFKATGGAKMYMRQWDKPTQAGI